MAKAKTPNQKKAYEKLNNRLAKYVAKVRAVYDTLNLEASKIATRTDYDVEKGKPFKWDDYPQTKDQVKKLQQRFVNGIGSIIMAGTSEEWLNSNELQDLLADKVMKAYNVKRGDSRTKKYYQVNNDALQAFQQRRDNGMNLSDRLWNQAEDYKKGLEATLSTAIERGMSAVVLSKRVSKYLRDFDSLKKDYKKRFGTATEAKDCEYRSIRLARSEINMAYRNAEQLRWQQMDFILGYEIKLSHSHPCHDICDDLKGKYPKDFKWTGWHPNDLCYVIPIIKTEEQFWLPKEERGKDNAEITDVPQGFKTWVANNQDRIARAEKRGTLPYFVRDNRVIVTAIKKGELIPSQVYGNINKAISQYKEVKPKRVKSTTSNVLMSDFTGGLATAISKGFEGLVSFYYQRTANAEKVEILRQIIKTNKFEKLKYHSTKNNSIYGINMGDFDKALSQKEMPKNLTIAKKLTHNGYDVYLLSNPNSIKSADFILIKNNKLYYAEGKTLDGKSSLDHLLAKGASQSDRIVVDIIGTNDVRYISQEVKFAFQQNKDLKEIILLKGSREISVVRKNLKSKDYEKKFKKIWEQKK